MSDSQNSNVANGSNHQYIVNPAFNLIRSNPDSVAVKLGSRSATSRQLTDSGRNGILADLLESWTTPMSLEQGRSLVEAEANLVDELLKFLMQEKVLIQVPELESHALLYAMGLETGKIGNSSIGVIGKGLLCLPIAEYLLDAGVGRLWVCTDETSPPSDRIKQVGGDPYDSSALDQVAQEADLVICATPTPDLELLFRLNSILIDAGKPWLPVIIDGGEIQVGPLLGTSSGPCYNCLDAQDEAGRTQLIPFLAYKASVFRSSNFTRRALPHFFSDMVASWAALAALHIVAGLSSFASDYRIRFDVERFEMTRDRVLTLPRCPACKTKIADYRHPFM